MTAEEKRKYKNEEDLLRAERCDLAYAKFKDRLESNDFTPEEREHLEKLMAFLGIRYD